AKPRPGMTKSTCSRALRAGRRGYRVGLERRALGNAIEPGLDIRIRRIDRLADQGAKIQPAKEQDVGEREALAAEIVTPVGHLTIQPLQAVSGDHLQTRRSLRHDRNA